jgi:oxygen-independent coproporphyrinogen-3 oxidase
MERALAGQAISNDEEVGRKALPFEFMLNTLRLKDGFELALFGERTGLPPSALAAGLAEAERRGLLEHDRARGIVRPSARGFDFLSDLQSMFLT